MDGTLYYYILKNQQGTLNKKLKTNSHLFFIPVDPRKYMYVILIGKKEEEENSYVGQLLVRLHDEIIDDTIAGEMEYFKGRFVQIESIPCRSSNQAPGNYVISLKKKGFNILSDLEINYELEYSTNERRIYTINGELNLVTGDVTDQDFKMVAAKQVAYMGKKERFEEMQRISNSRRLKVYHD